MFLEKLFYFQIACFTMSVKYALVLVFCSNPFITPRRKNDTNLKKKEFYVFFKTMV